MNRKLLVLFLTLVLFANACIIIVTEPAIESADNDIEQSEQQTISEEEITMEISAVEAGIGEISKYGNIVLTIKPEDMILLGYQPADIVLVRIGDAELEMPIGTSYSDVDSGEPICTFKTSSSKGVDEIVLAINAGDLASTMGIAERSTIDEDPGYAWTFAEGLGTSPTVYVSMAVKQGYADEYALHQLGNTRTNKREDYADLSDAEYANFRAVETTGMGKGILYRSTSPIYPALNRNAEADAALLQAGIQTVMNMTDSEEVMTQYPDFAGTSYAQCDIIALNMSMDFFSEEFREKLADGFRYLISHEGPYLIHCREGKDRTGFAAAILECLMGAGAEEIVSDYMLTYYNFYGITPDSEQYSQIAEGNIGATLVKAFGISSIYDENVDLKACAEAYLLEIGMSEDEIMKLKERLGEQITE